MDNQPATLATYLHFFKWCHHQPWQVREPKVMVALLDDE